MTLLDHRKIGVGRKEIARYLQRCCPINTLQTTYITLIFLVVKGQNEQVKIMLIVSFL
jgi:hypothetical protein